MRCLVLVKFKFIDYKIYIKKLKCAPAGFPAFAGSSLVFPPWVVQQRRLRCHERRRKEITRLVGIVYVANVLLHGDQAHVAVLAAPPKIRTRCHNTTDGVLARYGHRAVSTQYLWHWLVWH